MKYIKNEKEFESLTKKGLVLVDFYATWCGPCTLLSPIIEQLDKEKDDLTVLKVNVDENEALSKKHGIMSIPTLEIYKDGELINKVLGYQSKEEIEGLLK